MGDKKLPRKIGIMIKPIQKDLYQPTNINHPKNPGITEVLKDYTDIPIFSLDGIGTLNPILAGGLNS